MSTIWGSEEQEKVEKISHVSESNSIIRPTLHHFGVTTKHLDEMIDWYAKVLGTKPNYQSTLPIGKGASLPARVVFVTNDKANHRVALVFWSGLRDDPEKHTHSRLQHVAFEYETIDDLLNSYARLKGLGIEPLVPVDHGPTTAFYYEDPDGNSVELLADNFGNWDLSSEFIRTSPEFAANPMGTFVDPDKMIAARKIGMSFAELHRRAYAGEFPPSRDVDPGVLI